MIEAMARGTPVIAFAGGSVPEALENGVIGFVVPGEAGAIAAVPKLAGLSRAAIRQRFTATRMARDYLAVSRALAGKSAARLRLVSEGGAASQVSEAVASGD